MTKYKEKELYKKYLASSENFAFDELYEKAEGRYSINNLYEVLGIEIYDKKRIADIYVYEQNFRLVKDFDRNDIGDIFEEERESIFTYENGKILRYYFKFNKFIQREYMYIHLQKRKMTYRKEMKNFKIIPNSFEELKNQIDYKSFKKEYKKRVDRNYLRHFIKIEKRKLKKNLLELMGRFIEN